MEGCCHHHQIHHLELMERCLYHHHLGLLGVSIIIANSYCWCCGMSRSFLWERVHITVNYCLHCHSGISMKASCVLNGLHPNCSSVPLLPLSQMPPTIWNMRVRGSDYSNLLLSCTASSIHLTIALSWFDSYNNGILLKKNWSHVSWVDDCVSQKGLFFSLHTVSLV